MFGLCLGLPSSAASPCKRKPVIFNFGDSNLDIGGWSAGLGIDVALPNGHTFFHEATGWLCDRQLSIDFLYEFSLSLSYDFPRRESLNISFLSPYLESLGPNFSNGTNFAVSGAATIPRDQPFSLGHANLVGKDGFADALYTIDIGQNDLTAQFTNLPYLQVVGNIPIFIEEIRFAIWVSQQLPKDGRVSPAGPLHLVVPCREFIPGIGIATIRGGHANLVGKDGFADALYTIDIGQNDLTAQFTNLPYLQVVGNIPIFIEEIRFAIWSIYQSGGKNFWVHNTGPLGCLPNILVTTAHDASDIDELGCLRSRNDAAREFNRLLQSLCEELRVR
ncbi:hypothetical protein EUGRSUZ_J02640 [Eucalyptus grandis]|uniref:Uncharacterized protein n=2 Tax=Eucalyptus grandis TaxID=71139 RepID=A0ACC3K341_EUCGR|nr:hypothetical protein EUGRSUZ_J02640 [Eucalyptus grandis]